MCPSNVLSAPKVKTQGERERDRRLGRQDGSLGAPVSASPGITSVGNRVYVCTFVCRLFQFFLILEFYNFFNSRVFIKECVLLCFVKPILGNRYGPGVNSLRQ